MVGGSLLLMTVTVWVDFYGGQQGSAIPCHGAGALKMEDQKMQDLKMKDLLRLQRAFVVSCEQTCADMQDDDCWACDTMD